MGNELAWQLLCTWHRKNRPMPWYRRNRRIKWINISCWFTQTLDTTDCAIPIMRGFRQKKSCWLLNRQTADANGSLRSKYSAAGFWSKKPIISSGLLPLCEWVPPHDLEQPHWKTNCVRGGCISSGLLPLCEWVPPHDIFYIYFTNSCILILHVQVKLTWKN